MRMGNLLRLPAVVATEMAATQPQLGMRHLTVIPTNLRRNDESETPTNG